MAEDTEIEIVLKRSGLTFVVPPDKSILQVLIDEGIDPLYDCQRGECGICQVTVLEGVPTQPGTYVLKVDAWCYGTNVSGQTGGREYRIVIR